MKAPQRGTSGYVEGAVVGLAVAFFALAGSQGVPRPLAVYALLLLWPLVLLSVALMRRGSIAAGYLLALGILIRFAYLAERGIGSDVLSVTWEAIDVTLKGANPYVHAYASVLPQGRPYAFSYPPGNLLYYLPGFLVGDIRVTEIFSAALVLAGLAWAARLIRSDWPVAALGVYAAAPPLVALATDNSNDTSAGAVIFATALVLLLARRRSSRWLLVLAGLLAGEMLSFKLYTWPFWLPLVVYLAGQPWRLGVSPAKRGAPAWLVFAGLSIGFAILVSLPFFLRSPQAFVASLLTGPAASVHPITGWNVWHVLGVWRGWDADRILGRSLLLIDLGMMVLVTIIGLASGVRRPSQALLWGTGAWFALMFFARWTSYAYFAAVAPVVLLIPFADQLAQPGPDPFQSTPPEA